MPCYRYVLPTVADNLPAGRESGWLQPNNHGDNSNDLPEDSDGLSRFGDRMSASANDMPYVPNGMPSRGHILSSVADDLSAAGCRKHLQSDIDCGESHDLPGERRDSLPSCRHVLPTDCHPMSCRGNAVSRRGNAVSGDSHGLPASGHDLSATSDRYDLQSHEWCGASREL